LTSKAFTSPLEGEVCFQYETKLNIRKQGEGFFNLVLLFFFLLFARQKEEEKVAKEEGKTR
jgi:hypothetical protein